MRHEWEKILAYRELDEVCNIGGRTFQALEGHKSIVSRIFSFFKPLKIVGFSQSFKLTTPDPGHTAQVSCSRPS